MRIRNLPSALSKFFYVYLLLVLTIPNSVYAQESSQEVAAPQTEVKVKAIELKEIPAETEEIGLRIRKLKDILKPVSKTAEIDSLLNTAYSGINKKKDSLFLIIENLSQRELKVEMVDWENYHLELEGYQSTISSRLSDVNSINDEVVEEISRWQTTKEKLKETSDSEELLASMDTIVSRLQGVLKQSLNRLDSIFIIQKQLTRIVLTTDEVISEIHRHELLLQKDYFVFDNPAIWNLGKIEKLSVDTTLGKQLSNAEKIKKGTNEDFGQLKEFLNKNYKTPIFQIVFVLLLLTLLLVVKRKWKRSFKELTNPLEREAKIVIANPFSASMTVGLLISSFFYKSVVPAFSEIMILLILGGTVYLLPKLSHKKIRISLLILFIVYLVHSIEAHIDPQSILARVFLLFNSTILTFALIRGKMIINNWPENFKKISAFKKYIIPFYLVFIFVSAIANIIGMVRLAQFLTSAVLTSVGLGAVVLLSVKVITSIIILIFKLRSNFNFQAIADLVEIIQKRVRPALMFVGIILWILFTLMGFELYEYLRLWVNNILEIEWKIGAMTLSVGGILSFMTIFFITMFLAKMVATIFQDEWLVKVLPRGIAPAISLITRIILIATGFYIGLSAAGFDLSSIGILLGALGVGIGFGLQSVVLNFISGLILAFERPINLGDAIEVDQEFGIVTSIGVRASNIKTYSGSEVIIPNGDLVSKKVVNWTLTNRDRRTRVLMKTSAGADPEKVIELFNEIASGHPGVYKNPAPWTHFYGYNEEGNLNFALHYWTSFSDTLNTDNDIALKIYKSLKEEGIQAPLPVRRIISDNKNSFE